MEGVFAIALLGKTETRSSRQPKQHSGHERKRLYLVCSMILLYHNNSIDKLHPTMLFDHLALDALARYGVGLRDRDREFCRVRGGGVGE